MNGTLMKYAPLIVQWSRHNFGDQDSVADGRMFNELAPLSGLVEEIGEYYESTGYVEQVDSLVDIVVFLCDYAGRAGFDIAGMPPAGVTGHRMRDVVVQVALLHRYSLKTAQGIRKESLVHPREIIPKIVCIVENIYAKKARKQKVKETFWQVFATIVESVLARDWKKNSETGN